MKVENINILSLAYIGDAIYELYVREYLLNKNIVKVKDLQKEALSYVSATNQAKYLKQLIEDSFFTEEELDLIKRARNTKTNSKSKSCDIITYHHATALEAIVGFWYIKKDKRIDEFFNKIFKEN